MYIRYFIIIVAFILSAAPSEAQVYGCTDRLAVNYDPSATVNDGSCTYNPANIAPLGSLILDEILSETSGLIFWNNYLWTHNDNADNKIYSIDTIYGTIAGSYTLSGIENKDWEEISQDEDYIYIGDFGNNSGDRRDLRIFRISKNSLISESPVIDTINFSYSNQFDFASAVNNTDFDCEAFIVSHDSIYLFTKQWISNNTSLYSLPKTPGTYTAKLRSSIDVDGLITGAVLLESMRIVALSGYSKRLDPFVYLIYDFNGYDFTGGNKRKIEILLQFHQIEAITSTDGIKFYMSNEHFSLFPLTNTRQKIHIFDLGSFLGNYLGLSIPFPDNENNFIISPVPAHDLITVKSYFDLLPADYRLISLTGQIIMTGRLTAELSTINVSALSRGTYILRIGEEKRHSYKVIKE